MADAYFQLDPNKGKVLSDAIDAIDQLFARAGEGYAAQDIMGDTFEYLLSEVATAGKKLLPAPIGRRRGHGLTREAPCGERVAGMLDLLEAHLAAQCPFMLGADFSITDLMLLMLCRWTRMHARPAQTRPHLKRLIETVAARPAVVKTFAVEKLPLPWY